MTREPCSSLPSDWVTIPCGGTTIPVSALPSSGPASVSASTATSAGCPPVFIRYSSICAAAETPGPANQKSVPGTGQAAVTRPPGPVCSAAKPWASAPLAATITPPRPGSTGTALAEALVLADPEVVAAELAVPFLVFLVLPRLGLGAADGFGAVLTGVIRSTPGALSEPTEVPAPALPVPDSRVTVALP